MFDKHKTSGSEKSDNGDFAADTRGTPVATKVSTGAVIGATIKIKGEVEGDENLLIEGTVEGTVNLGTKHVTVGPSGSVQANINAQVIQVEGEVKGDMTGKEKVILAKTGKVQGNIVAPRVTLEDGAKFKGSIDMDPDNKTFTESPVTPIKSAEKTQNGDNKPATNG